jgi:dipeptidyl aminopeptidase/acylaminoacyl peptidase
MLQHEDPRPQEYGKSLLGDPEKDRAIYEASSPLQYIRNKTAPLLVLQDENDFRLPREKAVGSLQSSDPAQSLLSGKASFTLQPDRAGRFSIYLPEGYYDVLFSASGFAPFCKKIWIRYEKPVKLIFYTIFQEVMDYQCVAVLKMA